MPSESRYAGNVRSSGSWSSATFALGAPDGSLAAYTAFGTPVTTGGLQLDNYGFSIPGGATIDGIQATVRRFTNFNDGSEYVKDSTLRLLAAAGPVGDDKADTVTKWPISPGNATYGGAADDWNYPALSSTAVNATTFGAHLAASITAAGNLVTALIDSVQLLVSYTLTGGGGSTAGSFLLGMIAPRKLISFPDLWIPRPRPVFQFQQRRSAAAAAYRTPLTTHHSPLTV